MPANVETMFYVREKPWHGLGTKIEEAPTSADALVYAAWIGMSSRRMSTPRTAP